MLFLDHDPKFGLRVVKPSHMISIQCTNVQNHLVMHSGLRGPIYNQEDGKVMALSLDSNGQPVSEEQFKTECHQIYKTAEKEAQRLVDLCNNTNATIKAWAELHGLEVTAIYHEINRRGAIQLAEMEQAEEKKKE